MYHVSVRDAPDAFAVSPRTAIRVGLRLLLGGLWSLFLLRREVVIEVEPE